MDDDAEDKKEAAPAAKRAAVGMTETEDKEERLNLMILAIQTAQKQRMLEACAWWTLICPIELIQPGLNVTKEHAKQTKGMTGHKMGSPHIQLWRTFLKTLINHAEKLPAEPDHREEIETVKLHLQQFEKAGPQSGHLFCRQARAKTLKDPTKAIFHYALSPTMAPDAAHKTDCAIHRLMTALKCEVKPGTSPPSLAEIKLQRSIDQLKLALGKKVTRDPQE